jgi:hypothetical protein
LQWSHYGREPTAKKEALGVKTRHLASSVLLLVIAGLFIAASSVAAGEYTPRQLLAQRLLEPRAHQYQTVQHGFLRERAFANVVLRPKKLRFDYAVPVRQEAMLLSVQVRPKLRKIIQLKVRF